jgi:hypothetical protein
MNKTRWREDGYIQAHEEAEEEDGKSSASVRQVDHEVDNDWAQQRDQQQTRGSDNAIDNDMHSDLFSTIQARERAEMHLLEWKRVRCMTEISENATYMVVTVGTFSSEDCSVLNERRYDGNWHEHQESSSKEKETNTILQ